jgi:hypothetical protein
MVINKKSETKKVEANGAGLGIAIGAGLGLIFGLLTDNIGLCVGIGAALGLVFGFAFSSMALGKKHEPAK